MNNMKLCYYKVLGVESDCSDSDIKASYRKLALKWHPDKNLDDLEAAKERFQCIQEAYEVLSDPHERAWYDKHREQILRGKNSNYEDQCLDVYKYCSASCFQGYEDDAKGFYSVYRQVFLEISAEEANFISDELMKEIPTFGNSKSSYEDIVAPFYAYWSTYCTKKSYAWLCEYDIKEVKDRRIIRKIEKDMKKIVIKAKKMRNEEVRNLVSFVRKRDKRVQAYNQFLEEKAARNRKKQLENRMEQLQRRQQEISEMQKSNASETNAQIEDYEMSLKKLERMYSNESDQSDPEDKNSAVQNNSNEELASELDRELSLGDPDSDIYCVACNRNFRNVKAFANHEKSRRHRENERLLRKQMQAEEALYKQKYENLAASNEFDILDVESSEESPDIDNNSDHLSLKKNMKNNSRNKSKVLETKLNEEISEPEVLQDAVVNLESNKKIEHVDNNTSDNEIWTNSNKKMNKNNKKRRKAYNQTNNENITTDKESNRKDATTHCDTISNNTKSLNADTNQNATNICSTCKANFPSKNKLFAHLKLTNHAVYISKAKPTEDPTSKSVKANKSKRNKK